MVGFDPPAGTDLVRDQVVKVVVARATSGRRPRCDRAEPAAGQSNLEALGFVVKKGEDGRSASVDVGEVMAVKPGPGDGPAAFGSTVTIQVSAGVPLVTVPTSSA